MGITANFFGKEQELEGSQRQGKEEQFTPQLQLRVRYKSEGFYNTTYLKILKLLGVSILLKM